ncbi:MAG TPA: hypothetical protein VM891_06475 [Amaricoccus sp.]|nr:hypothetical protein [Amaricoccus sp.]
MLRNCLPLGAAAVATALVAGPALADSMTMARPIHAASLHDGPATSAVATAAAPSGKQFLSMSRTPVLAERHAATPGPGTGRQRAVITISKAPPLLA